MPNIHHTGKTEKATNKKRRPPTIIPPSIVPRPGRSHPAAKNSHLSIDVCRCHLTVRFPFFIKHCFFNCLPSRTPPGVSSLVARLFATLIGLFTKQKRVLFLCSLSAVWQQSLPGAIRRYPTESGAIRPDRLYRKTDVNSASFAFNRFPSI